MLLFGMYIRFVMLGYFSNLNAQVNEGTNQLQMKQSVVEWFGLERVFSNSEIFNPEMTPYQNYLSTSNIGDIMLECARTFYNPDGVDNITEGFANIVHSLERSYNTNLRDSYNSDDELKYEFRKMLYLYRMITDMGIATYANNIYTDIKKIMVLEKSEITMRKLKNISERLINVLNQHCHNRVSKKILQCLLLPMKTLLTQEVDDLRNRRMFYWHQIDPVLDSILSKHENERQLLKQTIIGFIAIVGVSVVSVLCTSILSIATYKFMYVNKKKK